MVNIKGLNKAEVLRALYNNSRVQGLGFLQATGRPMTLEEAKQELERTTFFDYLCGKVMKVNLSSDEEFYEGGYDRDNGVGAAQYIVSKLRTNIEIR